MNPSLSTPASPPLLFKWETPQRRKLAIAGFLAVSVLAHAACFYIFQIVYPPTIALLPPPARVGLISSASEEGRSLLRWIEAEDPALASTTVRSGETQADALPKVEHVPSYSGYQPVLKQPPPLIVDLRMPSAQPPGPVAIVRPRTPAAAAVVPTSASFSKELQGLGAANLPTVKFSASKNEPPENVRFHIGVSERGAIHYCFLLNSSGDSSLDEQARRWLVLARFPSGSTTANSAGQALVWGVATIEWGNDVARAPATP